MVAEHSQLTSPAPRSPFGQWRPAPGAAHPEPQLRSAGPRGRAGGTRRPCPRSRTARDRRRLL